MGEYRTWADVVRGGGTVQGHGLAGGALAVGGMVVQSFEPAKPGVYYAGPLVDREAGEGPPRCCSRRRIPADQLVWYGGISENALARLRQAFPHLADVPAEDIYLCDACISIILRAQVLGPDEVPRLARGGG